MSFIKDHMPKVLADQIFTEDQPKPAEFHTEPSILKARIPSAATPRVSFNASSLTQTPIAVDPIAISDLSGNNFAALLKDKTDFDKTDIGKQVAHEMKPLEGVASLTEADRIGIVLKAGAEEGLTAEKIVATFDNLLNTLDAESTAFQAAMTGATQSGPESIKAAIQDEADKIKDLEAQITATRAKQSDLSTDLIKSTTKIQTNTMQFSAAYEARKAELTSSKSHYQSILAGIR